MAVATKLDVEYQNIIKYWTHLSWNALSCRNQDSWSINPKDEITRSLYLTELSQERCISILTSKWNPGGVGGLLPSPLRG
jgi:hypothetical protein